MVLRGGSEVRYDPHTSAHRRRASSEKLAGGNRTTEGVSPTGCEIAETTFVALLAEPIGEGKRRSILVQHEAA